MSNEMQGDRMMEKREDYGLSIENPIVVRSFRGDITNFMSRANPLMQFAMLISS